MSVIQNNLLLAGDDAYNIQRSLRFRSSASAYLTRTPASAGNRKTWTYSTWIKRGSLGSLQGILGCVNGQATNSDLLGIVMTASDQLQVSSLTTWRVTTQVFRDPSAWYHFVVVWDTTQATASNRVKIYVNGVQVTSFGTSNDPTLNLDGGINQAHIHGINRDQYYSSYYFDGYTAETHFIDGQALTPSSFGENNAQTGVWQPKRYTGTYGTNGFYLPFTNNSTTTTLGNDFSGNGNNWTANNISITAGATYDSMTDVPTLTSATAANFCTINPLQKSSNATITNGNLSYSGGAASQQTLCTIGMTSGKWYWEDTKISGTYGFAGLAQGNANLNTFAGNDAFSWGYNINGNKYYNGTATAYGATWTSGDTIGIAFDADAGTLTFYKNGVSQGTAFTGLTNGPYFASCCDFSTVGAINFGQRPFAYTPPTGYVALNTFNLPTPTIGATASTRANRFFDISLWTGNGSTQTITGLNFQPDLFWGKGRSVAFSNNVTDSVRGAGKELLTDSTSAEQTNNGVTSFNSNGVTLSSWGGYNLNGSTFVGWQWRANGTGVTNTAGSITSTVSANTSSGFSVVTYTGNGSAGATIGHGLSVAPRMIIVQTRTGTNNKDKPVYHASIGNTGALTLNTTSATDTWSGYWNNTSPASTVFTVGSDQNTNTNGSTYVAYCFSEVAGYSKFGSYTGNGSSDGTFVALPFKPKFVMTKCSSTTGNWMITDDARNPYNLASEILMPNNSDTEYSQDGIDLLSNGFKLRASTSNRNSNGATYIYMAFAEVPQKFALGV